MKLFSALVVSISFASSVALAAPFTTDELPVASKAAADYFKAELGATLHGAIFGIQVQKSADGGKAKIFYKEGGVTKTLDVFCHHHDTTIDCHEH